MARCGVRCEYEQVSLLVVTVERIRAVGDPFRYGGQRQYMVPPEKTHETFVYCFAAAARFAVPDSALPGVSATGVFLSATGVFLSAAETLPSATAAFSSAAGVFPFVVGALPSAAAACPFVAGELLSAAGTLPFSAGASSVFVSGTLCSVPGFPCPASPPLLLRLPAAPFSVRFRCRHMRYFAAVVSPAGAEAAGACGITSESSCVMRSSSFTSPFSSAAMRSRTNSNVARFSFAIGSAGSCGTFSGSIGVPFSRCGSRDAVPSKRPSIRHSRSAGPAIRANPSKCLWRSRSGAGNPSSGCPHA